MKINIDLPIPIKYNFILREDNFNELDNLCGVYVFYNCNTVSDMCVYVGKSINLKNRLNTYKSKKEIDFTNCNFNDFFNNFKIDFFHGLFVYVCDKKDIHILETYLINKLNPYFNIQYSENKDITEFKSMFEYIVKNGRGIQKRINELHNLL